LWEIPWGSSSKNGEEINIGGEGNITYLGEKWSRAKKKKKWPTKVLNTGGGVTNNLGVGTTSKPSSLRELPNSIDHNKKGNTGGGKKRGQLMDMGNK